MRVQLFFIFRDTYEEAEFFTYNENNKDCFCKVCHDLNATRREATGRVSGNVNCYSEFT